MKDNKLTKQQDSALNILKTVVPLMEKNGLKYSMLGGTLLGAVRHQGFIPWDDDIDIGLPRPDYEKFVQIAEKELTAPLELQSALKGNGHYCYVRIVNTEVKLLRSLGARDEVINSWIDIFPLDGVPNGLKGNFWEFRANIALNLFDASDFSYRVPKEENARHKSLLRRIGRNVFKSFNLERLLNTKGCAQFLDNSLKSSDYNHCDKVWNFMGHWGKKEEFSKEIYDDMIKYPFEDLDLYGPKDYDCVLTQMYGDYMTPLPPEERDHHMTSCID